MPKLAIGQNLRETLDNSFTETFGNKPERYFSAPGRTEIGVTIQTISGVMCWLRR